MAQAKKSGEYMGIKFDNHVSLGNVVTVLAAFAAVLTWGNRMEGSITLTNSRVDIVEKSDAQQNVLIESIRLQTGQINTSLARIQERQDASSDSLREIKDMLRDDAPARKKKSDAKIQ